MGNSFRTTTLASAIGIALIGATFAPHAQAAQAGSDGSAKATQANALQSYIIRFTEPGLLHYAGGTQGLNATAPKTNGQRKLDVRTPAAQAYQGYLRSQRESHIAAIAQSLGRELVVSHVYAITMNGIATTLSAAEAARIAQLPVVQSVRQARSFELTTYRGPEYIGAPSIWDGSATPGNLPTRGEGIVVGDIDTGINSTHPSFADDPTCGFDANNHKLLSATDCTSTDVDGRCNGPNPEADDGNGHGVHTASTAAGNKLDGTAVPPPVIPPPNTFMSGVAQCAQLRTYKVCPASGCSDAAITAGIENAIADQVDAANFSIGPTCGSTPGDSPWSDGDLIWLDALNADVFVAASAGNTRANCSDPTGKVANISPWVTTVAASTHDQNVSGTGLLNTTGPGSPPPNTQNINLTPGTGVNPGTALTNTPIRHYVTNELGCTADGGFPPGYFDGAIALISRGTCTFEEKINNAEAAGALVAIIYNNTTGVVNMSVGAAGLPAYSILQVDGQNLETFMDANDPTATTVDFSPAHIQGDVLAGFSFRGPDVLETVTKPDITGPGVNIYAAETPSEGSYGLLSGTSMSSPHLAGSAALVRAVQPSWSVMEVKSALMTTASLPGVEQDGTTPWTVDDVGNGRVDLSKATRAGLTLDESVANFNAANPTGGSINQKQLNLASVRDSNCGASCTWTRTFKNRLHASGSYTLSGVDPAGYHLTFAPATFTLAQDATQAVTITATATSTPTATLSFGRIDIHESANQSPDQHLSVAVKGGTTVPPSGFCTGGNCNLQIDTMTTSFSGLGCASYCGFLWMNRYTPDAGEFPITLNSITTIFGSGAGWNGAGDHINVYVYQDGDGDPTNGATLVGSYIGYTMPTPVNSFATITLPTPIVINGPGDVIIALTNPTGNTGSRPAAMDAGVGYVTNRSYISNGTYVDTVAGSPPDLGSATVDPVPMDAIGISKTLVIRGTGTNGGGRPITLSIEPNAK